MLTTTLTISTLVRYGNVYFIMRYKMFSDGWRFCRTYLTDDDGIKIQARDNTQFARPTKPSSLLFTFRSTAITSVKLKCYLIPKLRNYFDKFKDKKR